MKEHARIGHKIASRSKELFYISNLILHHNEFWDGNGYPDGGKGEGIPLEYRISSIMDAYDAATSNRPYRNKISGKRSNRRIKKNSRAQFEPRLIDKFVKLVEE